jgi:hypothetical protein
MATNIAEVKEFVLIACVQKMPSWGALANKSVTIKPTVKYVYCRLRQQQYSKKYCIRTIRIR